MRIVAFLIIREPVQRDGRDQIVFISTIIVLLPLITYKVLDSGSTDPKITWEIVTDASNNAMIVNGEPISDFKVEAEYE